MDLYLRKVIHPQAHDNYRVILKREDGKFEIGSIGSQHGSAWKWGIDTVIPMRSFETEGWWHNQTRRSSGARQAP